VLEVQAPDLSYAAIPPQVHAPMSRRYSGRDLMR